MKFNPQDINKALAIIEDRFYETICDEVDVSKYEDNSRESGFDDEALHNAVKMAKIKFLSEILETAIDERL